MNLFRAQRFADGDRIEVAGAPVVLKVSARARRISIRIDAVRGEVIATAPTTRLLGEAVAFAGTRAGWIAARLAEAPPPLRLVPGASIEVLGRPCRLEASSGRARLWPGDGDGPARLAASGDGEAYARGIMRLLKSEARRVLVARTQAHVSALGRPMPVVAVMDAKARWGSCRAPRARGFGAVAEVGRIRYSWRLVMAPPAVLDYVVAHECAHLVEPNHSPGFWAIVHDLIGDHRPHRAWLRANGARLHAVG